MNQALSDFYLAVGWPPYTWFAALALASLLDALTTIYALRQPGMREANPVMRWAMGKLGIIPALLVIKLIPLVSLLYALQEKILTVPLWTALYLAVAGWNFFMIYRLRKG